MVWKKWPDWLKGGVIALLVAMIARFLLEFGFFEKLGLGRILYFSTRFFYLNYDLPFIANGISYFFWIVVGMIIGWIVGKIKNK